LIARRELIRQETDEAQKERDEANEKLAEVEARLALLDAEIAKLRQEAILEAELEERTNPPGDRRRSAKTERTGAARD